MNSILQCLSSLMIFSTYLRKDKYAERLKSNILDILSDLKRKKYNLSENVRVNIHEEDVEEQMKETVTYRLAEIFEYMWKKNCTITPKTFKQVLGKKNDIFNGSDQNDSQELLSFVLDTIHEETKTKVDVEFRDVPKSVEDFIKIKTQYRNIIKSSTISIDDKKEAIIRYTNYKLNNMHAVTTLKAYLAWKNYIKDSHSIITDLFTGLFYSSIKCKECNYESPSFEPFTMLSIPTTDSGNTTLDECLKNFSKVEVLDDKYNCSMCKKKVDAEKRMFIWEAPKILIIQLKRFKNTRFSTSKTNSTVDFPIKDLNLKNNFPDFCKEDLSYDLWAISEHRGSCNFGHYVAYAKNIINDKWYEFNDEDVVHIPNDDLCKEVITKNAYILFYERNDNVTNE